MVALKTGDVSGFLARPDSARPVVLVYGPDAGLVRERVTALLRASVDSLDDPFALVQLDGDLLSSDPARLVDEALTVPLLGGRRAIWVRAGTRNVAPAIELALKAQLVDCRIVIEAGDLKRSAPLRSMCERARNAAAIACYADGERDLARLIDETIRAAGMKITPDARAMLTSLLGGDRRLSRNELDKLTLYAGVKSEIDTEDVLAVVADAAALGLDSVIDAAFAGRPAEVEAQFARARASGTAAPAILAAALRQNAQLHLARLSMEAGSGAEEALEASFPRLHFRRKALVESALRGWTSARLLRVMGQLADAVRDTRVQAPLADAIAERALLSIAVSARRRS